MSAPNGAAPLTGRSFCARCTARRFDVEEVEVREEVAHVGTVAKTYALCGGCRARPDAMDWVRRNLRWAIQRGDFGPKKGR